MIMKANKQIGFIYKNNESIDKILKDGDVVFERGFLREKTSTTLPITFGGVGKDLKDYKIYGNTYQNSTRGVNLFNHYLYPVSRTYNGVSITNNGDGSFTLNGTCTSNNTAFAIGLDTEIQQYANEGRVTQTAYYISGTCTKGSSSNARTTIRLNYDTGYDRMIPLQNLSTQGIISKTHPQDSRETGWSWRIVLDAGDTFDNFTIKYQLEKGSESTDYEPYTGGQPSPNPDYPQEIISCGDKSENLYNPNDINTFTYSGITLTRNTDDSYTINGTSTSSSLATRDFTLSNPITLKSGESVTFSKDNALNENLGGLEFRGNNETLYILNTNTLSYTYTAISDITIDTIRTFYIANSTYDNYTFKLFIARGSNPTNEPYYEGYKIPVNVRSDNLFDKDNANIINAFLYNNKCSIREDYGDRTLILLAKPNTTYTVSRSVTTPTFRVAYTNNDLPTATSTRQDVNVEGQITDENASSITITTGNLVKYLLVCYGHTRDTNINESLASIQIVEGSTVPSKYIPYYNETTNIYLDEPLRKTKDGTYVDYIDFINGKVVRNIGSKVYNGSENGWYISGKSAKIRLSDAGLINISNLYNYSESLGNVAFCNYFKQEIPQTLYTAGSLRVDIGFGIAVNPSTSSGLFFANNISSLNDFKEWLSANNVTVDYVLETPTEESITLPSIPTVDGNNTLNIETEITPSQVYIKYKSNT